MTLPVTIPNTFANATTSIPLANLDANFVTIYGAVNGIGNGAEALANVNISGGNVNVTTVTVAAGTSAAPSITTAGDTNTGIFFPAADTIAFAEGGAEAMRIDSSGNVLISKTAIDNTAGIALRETGQIFSVRDGGTVCTLNRLTSDGGLLEFQKDSTAVGSIGTVSSQPYLVNADATYDAGIRVNADNTYNGVLPCDNAGALTSNTLDLGATVATFRNAYLGGAVYLGGTAAANALDDYEEGTFTPEVADATTGGNTATGTIGGVYTKIGNLVTCYATLSNLNKTGMTAGNTIYIRNLPFVASASANGIGSVVLDQITFSGFVTPLVIGGQPYMALYEMTSNAADALLTVSDIAVSGASDIFFTVTYFAA